VLTTLFNRLWGVVSGFFSLILIPLFLSSTEQGYYYTFASLMGISVLFELGLNSLIAQTMSRDIVHLEQQGGRLVGQKKLVDNVQSLIFFAKRWYLKVAISFGVIVIIIGAFVLNSHQVLSASYWAPVWVALVVLTATNLFLSPRLALHEGMGFVGKVALLRLKTGIVGSLLLWILLLSGYGLWAVIAFPSASVLITLGWLNKNGETFRWIESRDELFLNKKLGRDLLSVQFRLAVSWICGYIIYNLFVPLTFMEHGAVEAGQLGMSLAIFQSLGFIGMSWCNAKVPKFAGYVSQKDRIGLNSEFSKVFSISIAITIAMCFGVLGLAAYATSIGMDLMSRISPLQILALIALVTVVNNVIFLLATYLRAHLEEPMLNNSVISAFLVAASCFFGLAYGVETMIFSYFLVMLCISLPWTIKIFLGYYRRQ